MRSCKSFITTNIKALRSFRKVNVLDFGLYNEKKKCWVSIDGVLLA